VINRSRFSNRWTLPIVFLAASACAHPRFAPTGFNISSERSDYSPAVRLAIALPVVSPGTSLDTIAIVIDSAIVTAPGAITADTTPLMQNLYVTAILATRDDGGERSGGLSHPWRALAESDSILLADELHLGQPRAVGRIRLGIVPPRNFDPSRSWLVFRITGDAVTNAVMLANGTMIGRKPAAAPIRVFACADWTLAGHVDPARAKALARAYTAAC
jgi:hypothetical protein